jgi:TPR repeat protein
VRYIIAALFSLVLTTAVAGDLEDGWAAHERQDYRTALTKWRSAAQQGEVAAQLNLGLMYEKGQGVVQDYKEAVRWVQLAARQGYVEAQYNLGVMYAQGKGVAQDYKEAMRLYKLAARQGSSSAQHNLGVMHREGQGLLRNNARAHMWFNIAAIGGDSDSMRGRDELERKMTAQQIEQSQRMARECMNSNFTKCD